MSTDINVKYSESKGQVMLQYPKPTLRYLDEFTKLKCAPDLLINNLFPNAKEITESMGAYNAMRKHLMHQEDYALDDPNTLCIVVGDGCTPRTGALFAMRTHWDIISIDPRLRLEEYDKLTGQLYYSNKINRLCIIPCKIEETNQEFKKYNKVLIVAVHSHASLFASVKKIKSLIEGNTIVNVISIPCCVEDNLSYKPTVVYRDWGIHSEKRQINIYKIP